MLKVYTSTLLFVFILPAQLSAYPTSSGVEYLVSSPLMPLTGRLDMSAVEFFLTTWAKEKVKVQVTCPWYRGDKPLGETLFLKNDQPVNLTLQDIYKSKKDLGRTWTYRFVGSTLFDLTVFLIVNSMSAGSFQAISVTGWGIKYQAVTLGSNPFILIISASDENGVTVMLMLKNTEYAFIYEGVAYRDREEISFILKQYEAFVLSICTGLIATKNQDLSGTVITGDLLLGVISGSCATETPTLFCQSADLNEYSGKSVDLVVDMLLPADYYGSDFILPMVIRAVHGYVYISPSNTKQRTQVNISVSASGAIETLWLDEGFRYKRDLQFHTRVVSDRPIQIVFVQRSSCLDRLSGAHDDDDDDDDPPFDNVETEGNDDFYPVEMFGDASISSIIPQALFYFAYQWRNPVIDNTVYHYAVLIVKHMEEQFIQLNDETLPKNVTWDTIWGDSVHNITNLLVTDAKSYTVVSTGRHVFGCYVYGVGGMVSYMSQAGFQNCFPDPNHVMPGDLIDNDCDGSFDEEMENAIDDDQDSKVDEDTRYTISVNGEWSEWQPWTCNENCTNRLYYRKRLCDNPPKAGKGLPCPGQGRQIQQETSCIPEIVCPLDCAPFTWGVRCRNSCINCIQDCDKYTGECSRCKGGFKNSKLGCIRPCQGFEYGEDCTGNCLEKCGQNCVDHVTGDCTRGELKLAVLITSVLFLVILITLAMSRHRYFEQFGEESQPLKTNAVSQRVA